MKKFVFSLIFGVIIFIALSVMSCNSDLHVDGVLTVGFPFNFYTEFSDCIDCPKPPETSIKNIIINFLFSVFIGFILISIFNKIRKK